MDSSFSYSSSEGESEDEDFEISEDESGARGDNSEAAPSQSTPSNIDKNCNSNVISGPSWEVEKLHPPKEKSTSKVWKIGGFRKVNGVLHFAVKNPSITVVQPISSNI